MGKFIKAPSADLGIYVTAKLHPTHSELRQEYCSWHTGDTKDTKCPFLALKVCPPASGKSLLWLGYGGWM